MAEPEVWQNIETGVISEKYEVDGKNIYFNLDNSPINFDLFKIQVEKKNENEIRQILFLFENVEAKKILVLSKVISMSDEEIILLKNNDKVSVSFSIKEDILVKYIEEKYRSIKPEESLFSFKDENNSIVVLNFKYFQLEDIVL